MRATRKRANADHFQRVGMTGPSTEPAPGLTLFTDKITARENERRMRVAQARRDRRDEFAAMIGRGRLLWAGLAMKGN